MKKDSDNFRESVILDILTTQYINPNPTTLEEIINPNSLLKG